MKRTISIHLAIAQILVVFISWLLLQLHEIFYKRAREEMNCIEDSRRKLKIATREFMRCCEILINLRRHFYDAPRIEFDEINAYWARCKLCTSCGSVEHMRAEIIPRDASYDQLTNRLSVAKPRNRREFFREQQCPEIWFIRELTGK